MKNKVVADFCLLIPCYNNFTGLVYTLKTVQYPAGKFLVLVVDDGSTVPVETNLRDEVDQDFPVRVLRNPANEGITRALNNGLAWISEHVDTKYIARVDCGDICAPERFTVQVEYMNVHPDVGLLGCYCRFIDEKTGMSFTYKAPHSHSSIQRAMYFRNPFMHASVMFRFKLLERVGYYPPGFQYAEDYALFWILTNNMQSFVLNQYLVTCPVNRKGISYTNKGKQLVARWKVVRSFSENNLLMCAGFIKLSVLFVLPKSLILRLKNLKG